MFMTTWFKGTLKLVSPTVSNKVHINMDKKSPFVFFADGVGGGRQKLKGTGGSTLKINVRQDLINKLVHLYTALKNCARQKMPQIST